MRTSLIVGFLFAAACGDGTRERICLNEGAYLDCLDSASCCDLCRLAVAGADCSGTATCRYEDTNMSATCSNGSWVFASTNADLSVSVPVVDASVMDLNASTDAADASETD